MTFVLQAASALEKHRVEKEAYRVDFKAGGRLATGETLSGTPEVKVFTEADGADTDVSSEFTIASVAVGSGIDGTASVAVTFTMDAAGTGDQDAGEYVLRVKCTTSSGRIPVSVHRLTVSERGDSGAP